MLHWLAENSNWNESFPLASQSAPEAWQKFVALANSRIDLVKTIRLDKAVQRRFAGDTLPGFGIASIRCAVLGSNTVAHLLPAIRIGGLRRNLWVTTYTNDHGQYIQELLEKNSALHAFAPTCILFAFEASHLLVTENLATNALQSSKYVKDIIDSLRRLWQAARDMGAKHIIQQAFLPVSVPIMGNNEHRCPAAPLSMVMSLNEAMRNAADEVGVDILSIDHAVVNKGLSFWHDRGLWLHAKQEISPAASPIYGDLVGRLLAAQQGKSFKCLVLDLDNTLWGGVIGDDGMDGIVLGQGSSTGEAFVAFQCYAKQLAQRGIILAVCSKNDEANALAVFEQHPEMVLRRPDIACFVANWDDKANNIRRIASTLNIGLDAIVFADDNPFERNIIRRELPMVAVPEMPEDPTYYVDCMASAGYFEALKLTEDDFERSGQYQGNLQREALRGVSTDMPSYLKSLNMELHWKPFDSVGLQRITQLINKTNQFNLTTKRYAESDIRALMDKPDVLTLQLRLIDCFGDNGIIGIVIAKPTEPGATDYAIDTWLMSCRVLGRQVEEATLNLLAEGAGSSRRLIGEYRPTAKNGMVKDHYQKLGFTPLEADNKNATRWVLNLERYAPFSTFISIKESQR